MKSSSHHIYMDVIRVMSCVLVVCIHVSAMDFNKFNVTTGEWFGLNVINCIGMNGVPLFFMLSGALFLSPEYQISLKKLVFGKVLKLICLYWLTLFVYNLIPFIRGWVSFTPDMIKEHIVEGVIYEKGVYHLWFIPVLILIYLFTPVLKEGFQKQKICEYFLVLFFFGEIFINTLSFFELPGAMKRFIVYCQQKNTLLPLIGYIGYFVLGHYLHEYVSKLSAKKMVVITFLVISANLFTIVTCYMDSVQKGYPTSVTNTPLSAGVLISSSGTYILVKHYCNKINNQMIRRSLKTVAGCTLGIYLLHPMVLSNINIIKQLEVYLENEVILTIVRIVFVCITTFILVVLIKVPIYVLKFQNSGKRME